jgi:DNA-directed RNA polymerase subunit beta
MERKWFRDERKAAALPDLIEIQKASYGWLFTEGIRELLDEISPVLDFTSKNLSLEFGDYTLEKPKIDEETARQKNLTYKASLKSRVALKNLQTGKTKESEVFLGDFPVMTPRGTFIINGVERVVVTQIVRSYGVIFTGDDYQGRKLFGAKIIPSRGAWLEFETGPRDVISVKIDRKRKISVTTLLRAMGVQTNAQIIKLFNDIDDHPDHRFILSTLERDPAKTVEEALVEVYKRIRPGDLATSDSARTFLEAMLWSPKRYDLGKVGRYKMNQRLEMNVSEKERVLRLEDLVAVIREVIRLNNEPLAVPDDVDHLKNRRIRAVGELVQGRLRVGFLRMERIIRDRMSVLPLDSVTPSQLINARPIIAVLQEFFASSQLSQFMDQTNPLSELEHKRRLAATGPGGLSRERAGFEVRDVHTSHYGRICPIATPEGPNVGLVGQLACYARVNQYGFVESPYYEVKKAKNGRLQVTETMVYLSASEEDRAVIAPASTNVDRDGYLVDPVTVIRHKGTQRVEAVENINYIDVSAKQIVSISTSLIPFVEHDAAERAMMGSNMQRQAVPLVRPDSPVVGTGMEADAARDSGQIVVAASDGTITEADASHITLVDKKGNKTVHRLMKFLRSNQGTSMNQRPLVKTGDGVKAGQVIADSSATDQGELALGQNILVAFLSYKGGVYEDAITISERLVQGDRYTSIHIEQYPCEVRDTKLGPEVITQDIPNVGEEALANLDDNGIIRIGAEVSAGDILAGKITPKGETELSAEERLLRAIFGEKAKDVKDTSLRLPHGERGKVVGIKMFSKDAGDELPAGVYQRVEISIAQLRKVSVGDKFAGRHGNKGIVSKILPIEEMPYLPDGTPVDIILNPLGVIGRMNLGQILETHLGWAAEKLGYKVASPVFNGVPLETIHAELKKAGLPEDGKTVLYDGRSGLAFDQRVTVGTIYMLKLIHLVDDKMHARSIGPYSMVTQQPLGGKAQFGGQRFGEMEVWALEAYGAAHTLQEMITIKSDDIAGRSRAYESIIRAEPIQKPSIPATFFVLVRELESLGLSVKLMRKGKPIGSSHDQELVIERVAGETEAHLHRRQEAKPEPVLTAPETLDAQITELAEPEPELVSEPVAENE